MARRVVFDQCAFFRNANENLLNKSNSLSDLDMKNAISLVDYIHSDAFLSLTNNEQISSLLTTRPFIDSMHVNQLHEILFSRLFSISLSFSNFNILKA